jgi:TATA-box binding protein (TBP) (component of TFIID and TFIIIB)
MDDKMKTCIKLCKYNKYVKFVNCNNFINSIYNIGNKLNLLKLSAMIKYSFDYNPYIHPGLRIYYNEKLFQKNVVIIVFSSGNIVIRCPSQYPKKIIINCVNYINKIIYAKYLNVKHTPFKKIKILKK